ncbi:MAG: NAD(P)H-hydrate dehydratase [Acidimicrobiia bacterium]
MQPILTPDEASSLDAAADVTVGELMERAGLAVALAVARLGLGYGHRVTVLAGPGNNGGDGWVAARHLAARGVAVRVLTLADPRSGAAVAAAEAAAASGIPGTPWREPDGWEDLVVDAVFGAGFRGPLPDEVQAWVSARPPLVAVDLPSGLAGRTGERLPTCFDADTTVTFGGLKRGHVLGAGPDVCGDVRVVDIGLPEPVTGWWLMEDRDVDLPVRERTTHKWRVGGVAVVGGAPGMAGAPVLAARGALAFGAGAALVARPPGLPGIPPGALLTAELGSGPALGTDDAPAVLALADRWSTLVLGPGLGADGPGLARSVADRWSGPLVMDADALDPSIATASHRRSVPMLLTPHAGEFERLTGRPADPGAAEAFAREAGAVVLLKGNPTVVTDGVETWVVDAGGPELATIGTGDVLAGMAGALLARGLDPLTAGRTAAHLHGRAGAHLAARRTVTADALVDEVARMGAEY